MGSGIELVKWHLESLVFTQPTLVAQTHLKASNHTAHRKTCNCLNAVPPQRSAGTARPAECCCRSRHGDQKARPLASCYTREGLTRTWCADGRAAQLCGWNVSQAPGFSEAFPISLDQNREAAREETLCLLHKAWLKKTYSLQIAFSKV